MSQERISSRISKTSVTRRTVLSGAAAIGLSTVARAELPAEVKVGLIVPLSGIYSRPGQVMRMGAEMGIEHTMQAMVRLVDSFLVLDHGAVIIEGEPEAVTRDSRVIEAYLGKKWVAHAPH